MKHIIKRKNNLNVSKWSGGSTTELFVFPDNSCYAARNFEIRISSATVDETPSTFTNLPAYHRVLMPINTSLKLIFNKQKEVVLQPLKEPLEVVSKSLELEVLLKPLETVEFEGAWETVSHGLCTDIGIMLSPNWIGKLFIADNKTLADNGTLKVPCGFTGIYALKDNIEINIDNQEYTLSKGDFAIFETDTEDKMILTLPDKNTAIITQITKNN